MGKFNTRTNEGIFLGYFNRKGAYKCYKKRLRRIVKSIDVKIDEKEPQKTQSQEEKELDDTSYVEKEFSENEEEQEYIEPMEIKTPTKTHRNQRTQKTTSRAVLRNHPKELIIGDIDDAVQTQRRDMDVLSRIDMEFISMLEPKEFNQ